MEIVGDQTFLNQMILGESRQCFIFGAIAFFEADFTRNTFYELQVQKL